MQVAETDDSGAPEGIDAERVGAWQKLARERTELSGRQATFAAVEAKRKGRVATQALRNGRLCMRWSTG